MSNHQKDNQSPFKLEGNIHDQNVSSYIEEQIEVSRRRPRLIIAILAILLFIAFIWGAVSQYNVLLQKDNLVKLAHYQKSLTEANKIIGYSSTIQDSLENVIFKLRTENDLLAENSNPPIGVFFEVQIASFKDFNLDKYNRNLANLRQVKHDGKTKFLLGRFKSFKRALIFESDLKRMGINNAFIVGRIDDRIVTYKEALEALEENNN